jgi:CRISPR-associated exonuclease Cas4
MTYTEDDLLPISALQHLLFCERQCALIHIEQMWAENLFTAEGQIMHKKVHESDRESRGAVRVEYGMPLRSLRLGLVGKADVVELHRETEGGSDLWRPFPIEYKRGKQKKANWDRVQLCAQALCLEEMLNLEVPAGALFYGRTRRREDVAFDASLREETEETAKRLHELIGSGATPEPVFSKRCRQCSLMDHCQPKALSRGRSVENYLIKAVRGL